MLLSHLLSANDGMEVLIVDGHKVTRSERNGIMQYTVIFWCCSYIVVFHLSQPSSVMSFLVASGLLA